MLHARVETVRDTARVNYKGDTIDTPDGPLHEIKELIQRGVKKLLVNFEGVDYLNSAGISSLIATHKLVNEYDAKLALYNLQPGIEKVIRLTRMDSILPCFENENEAARYVGTINGDSDITKREKIIVIEEDLDITRSLQNIFEEFKQLLMYSVHKSENLNSAFDYVKESKEAGLIILDVNHSPTGIMEFLEKTKTDPSIKHIPIIIVTKDENISNAHFMIRNGADDMLRYPFNKYEAASRLRFALYHQREIEKQLKKNDKAKMAMAFR